VFETPPGAQPAPFLAHEMDENFEGIRLRGYNLEKQTYRPGETLNLEIAWQAAARVERDYTTFVHVMGPENPASGTLLWGQEDAQPCDNSYPTTWWSPGEWIVERRVATIDPNAPEGEYQLAAGWYELASGQRLSTDSGKNHVILATIHIGRQACFNTRARSARPK
jgi:hypothetical protein